MLEEFIQTEVLNAHGNIRDIAHCCTSTVRVNNIDLKNEIQLHYISRPIPYRAVNTIRLGYKTSQLMLYREIIAVCSEIHTKHINTLCGQNAEFMNVKPGGI